MFYVSPYLYVALSLIFLGVIGFTILAIYKRWFRWDSYSYVKATSSPVGPLLLFLFRLFVFCYGVIVLGVSYYLGEKDAAQNWGNTTKGEFFSYYTIWNYMLLTLFFLLASALSFTRLTFAKQKNQHDEEEEYYNVTNKSRYWFLGTVVWVLFEISITMSVLVDTVLWGFLYPYCIHDKGAHFCKTILFNFESINCHILNFVFIFTEFALNRLVIVPAHVLFVLYWAFAYMVFAWIYYSQTLIWDYPFMETHKATSAASYAFLLLLHVVYYFLIYGLDRVKIFISKPKIQKIRYQNLDVQDNSRGVVIF